MSFVPNHQTWVEPSSRTMVVYALPANKRPVGFAPWPPEPKKRRRRKRKR